MLATLFTSFTENDPDITSTVPVEFGTPEFVAAVEAVTRSPRLPVDSEIVLFNDP
jgi:hypothetical protein